MNEKQAKEAAAKRGAVCSVTGGSCECVGGGGCRNREPLLDRVPDYLVRSIKACRPPLEEVAGILDGATHPASGFSRRHPLPEARDWCRRLYDIVHEMREVLG